MTVTVVVWLCMLLVIPPALAQSSLAVIYPQLNHTDDHLFQDIILGIETEYHRPILIQAIESSSQGPETINWLALERPDVVIALGSRGFQLAKQIPSKSQVVIGGLPLLPNGMAGISLLSDPKILFNALRKLAPEVTTVHVVFSPRNRWQMGLATEQARLLGLSLRKVEAKNLKEAALAYSKIMKEAKSYQDSIWLPMDNVSVHESAILPELLSTSWHKKIVLFSTKIEHAKRGALFTMSPDYVALGASLVKLASDIRQEKRPSEIYPLQDLKLSVNLNTAKHLSIDFSDSQIASFNTVYPK